MKLAKGRCGKALLRQTGFAALPGLPLPTTSQTEGLLSEEPSPLPEASGPLPYLPRTRASVSRKTGPLSAPVDVPQPSIPSPLHSRPPPRRSSTASSDMAFADPESLSLAHDYLDLRLRPFWSHVLPYRRVSISVYTIPLQNTASDTSAPPSKPTLLEAQDPLLRTTFTTNAQGHFSHNLIVPWERICTDPSSLGMAFSGDEGLVRTTSSPEVDELVSWGLYIEAQLLADRDDGPVSSESGIDCTKSGINYTENDLDGSSEARVIDRGTELGVIDQLSAGRPSFAQHGEVQTIANERKLSCSSTSGLATPLRNQGATRQCHREIGNVKSSSWTAVPVSSPGGTRIISDLVCDVSIPGW
jgi:hypothetical protein